jgi:hypothetical protein
MARCFIVVFSNERFIYYPAPAMTAEIQPTNALRGALSPFDKLNPASPETGYGASNAKPERKKSHATGSGPKTA